MTSQNNQVTGLILAGGRASRFDGIDKGLIPLSGIPLVQHVINRLKPQVGRLIISANREIPSYEAFGLPVIPDGIQGFKGPLAGILTGLQQMTTDWLACSPCDTPLIPDNLVESLLDQATNTGAKICIAKVDQQAQYLHTLIHRSMQDDLRDYLSQGRAAVRDWYAEQPEQSVSFFSFPDATQAFTNLNQPEELATLEAWMD